VAAKSKVNPKPVFFTSPAAFGAWLAAHHASATELVVGYYKTATGKPSLTWPESVDEALCYGWIDGVRRSLGAEAYMIRFTPRKPTSIWSAINVAKIAALRAAGRMRPPGEAAFAKRRADKTGVYSFERREAAQLAPAQAAQLAANAKASAWFGGQAPWYQRTAIHWVISAKREETRARRLATLIRDSAAGRRIKTLIISRSPGSSAAARPARDRRRPSARAARGRAGRSASGR
jgi:uncharacterized protein YdeI (YjbR/CyaY-like superfamily)